MRPSKQKHGFTIVELLIVIVVIGILSAITIVAYNGVQARANNTAIQSDLTNFKKKLELARIDAVDGLYPSAPTSAMGLAFTKSAYKLDRNNLYYCVSADRTQFAVGAASKAGDTAGAYTITNSGSIQAVSSGVSLVSVCALVGKPDGTTAVSGYSWTGTAGTWSAWAN